MVACEFALNQTWYVTFESESDAMSAYAYLHQKMFKVKQIISKSLLPLQLKLRLPFALISIPIVLRHPLYLKGKQICARIKLKPMIRLPSGPPPGTTSGTGTTGTNTPTATAAPSPVISAAGNQPMQSGNPTDASNAHSPVGVQTLTGPNAVSTVVPVSSTGVTVAVSGSPQAVQQPGNSVSGNISSASKNAFNRPAPSPVQAQQQINVAPSTTPGKPVAFGF